MRIYVYMMGGHHQVHMSESKLIKQENGTTCNRGQTHTHTNIRW